MSGAAFVKAKRKKRLLTVGHSYVRRSNRLLGEAIASAANGEWDVTVAGPRYYQGNPRFGDLTPETLVVDPSETVDVVGLPVHFTGRVHVALYTPQLRTLMARGFDAIHCWEEPFVLSTAQMALWAPREAIFTVLSWQNIDKRYPPPFNWLERKVLTRADGWVGGASLVAQALRNRPVYRERPHRVMGFGVDTTRFRPDPQAAAFVRSSLGWPAHDTPVVGYLGRFTEAKGVRLLMRALDGVGEPWRGLFVGGGALDAELRGWARRYGTDVRIVPSVSADDVPNYMNAIDILCVPSQTTPTWREQFGRVLIEAFACGVCVVASDSAEIPFVVGDAGSIVGERDADGWRREIDALLRDAVRRRALGERGLHCAQTQHTWAAIGARYVEFFESLQRSPRVGAGIRR
jgi:glycosyltransferase involved in cell wall biosynthesis